MIAHILSSLVAEPEIRLRIEPLGYATSGSYDNRQPPKEFAEHFLPRLERCDVLVVDSDFSRGCDWAGFCVGYAVARGKSIIAFGSESSAFLKECAVIVPDLKALEEALASFRNAYHCR